MGGAIGADTVNVILASVWHWLLAFGLAIARPFAMLSVAPVFTRMQLSGLLRGAAASAFAMPMLPALARDMRPGDASSLTLLLAFAKEAVLGGVLGIALGAPFWALALAGDVIDNARGANQGRLSADLASGEDEGVTGTLLILTGIMLFVLAGGLQVVAQALYTSWALWKPFSAFPTPAAGATRLILGLLDQIMRTGLRIAAPVIIAALLADVTLIIIGRFAPQLRVEDLAVTARNLVFTLFMPLYCAFMILYMRQDQAQVPHLVDQMKIVLHGHGQPL